MARNTTSAVRPSVESGRTGWVFRAMNGDAMRQAAAHLLGDLPLEGIPLPEKPLAQAPYRALREGWYSLGAQMLHAVEKRI